MSYVDKVLKNENKRPKEAVNVLCIDKKFSTEAKQLKLPGLHVSDSDEEKKEEADEVLDSSSSDEEFNDTEDEAEEDEEFHSEASVKR